MPHFSRRSPGGRSKKLRKNVPSSLDLSDASVDNPINCSLLGAARHGWGYFFPFLSSMAKVPAEPAVKRAVVFIDGQNLFNAAKTAFGYSFPNYDPMALAKKVCTENGWTCSQIQFYTGMPDATEDPSRHTFWTNKLVVLRRQGVIVFTRPIRYRDKVTRWPENVRICLPDKTTLPAGATLHKGDGTPLPAGTQFRVRSADEKGVDVRIAVDVLKLGFEQKYDVGLIFSQDQDLSEATDEVKEIAKAQKRWVKLACAFPDGPNAINHRGINNTDWVRIDKVIYDACVDPFDYRKGIPPVPPSPPPSTASGGS